MNIVDKIKTHILCSITFFPKVVLFMRGWKKYGRCRQATDGIIIWRMRFACWRTKVTDTHSEHVTLIAFPRQELLHLCREKAMLLYTYIASVVSFVLICLMC
jgi:hypothetical protein